MRYFITLLFGVLTSWLYAQPTKSAYEGAVDYMGCTITWYTLDGADRTAFKNACNCESSPNDESVIEFLKDNRSKTNFLIKEVQSLKNDYNAKWSEDKEINFLTEEIFRDGKRYAKLNDFYKKHGQEPNFNSLLSGIKSFIVATNKPKEPSGTPAVDSQKKPAPKLIESAPADSSAATASDQNITSTGNKSWFRGFTFQIDVFALTATLICFGLVFYGLRTKADFDDFEDLKRRLKDLETERNKSPSVPLQMSNNQPEALRKEIAELKEQVANIRKSQTNAVPPSLEVLQYPALQATIPTKTYKEPEPVQEIFYLPTPNADRTFDVTNASLVYKEGISIYKAIKTSRNRADFQIDDHETSLKLALQYAELRIEPCCSPQNAYNPMARRIDTIKPGTLELTGDKWTIVDKSQIKYEN